MAGARETVASNTPHGAVALPKRQHRQDAESSAPVWSLESTAGNGNAEVPLGEWSPRVLLSTLVSLWRIELCADYDGQILQCGDQNFHSRRGTPALCAQLLCSC